MSQKKKETPLKKNRDLIRKKENPIHCEPPLRQNSLLHCIDHNNAWFFIKMIFPKKREIFQAAAATGGAVNIHRAAAMNMNSAGEFFFFFFPARKCETTARLVWVHPRRVFMLSVYPVH